MDHSISDRGVRLKSERLVGKRVGFGVCGGIGAVEVVKAIRELRRHGAEVVAFLTPSAGRFITELSVEWASGHPVLGELSAEVDHLEPFDLVLVAPTTLNTLSRCALGMADNAVTTLVAGQLGRKGTVLFVPTMNLQLRSHPLYDSYQARLEEWGARFFPGEAEEDRLKMPPPEALAEWVIRNAGSN